MTPSHDDTGSTSAAGQPVAGDSRRGAEGARYEEGMSTMLPPVDQAELIATTVSEEFSTKGGLWVYPVLIAFTLFANLFAQIELTRDYFIPFKSGTFILACCLVFYWGVTYSVQEALHIGVGCLIVMCLVRSTAPNLEWSRLMVELPLVAVFFAGLAILPNLVPWMVEEDIARLRSENHDLGQRLGQLREVLSKFQKEEMQDRMSIERRDLAALTSRLTSLHGFARELQQAGSTREILNLLFHNFNKVFKVTQAMLLIPTDSGKGVVIAKAMHKRSEDLENQRFEVESHEILTKVFSENTMVHFPESRKLFEEVEDLEVHLVIPMLEAEDVHAVYVIGSTASGPPGAEDILLMEGMVKMAEGAVEQLKIAMVSA